MPNLGNAWHLPGFGEPRGFGGMRDPIGAIVPGTPVTIITGNQFQGPGNPGNQLQVGSSVSFRRAADPGWTTLPLTFLRTVGNNKYYSATLPGDAFQVGDVVAYYLRIAYDDRDTTFLHAQGDASATTANEMSAQGQPFTFTVQSSADKGSWGPVFILQNVAIHTSVLPNGRVLMWGRRDAPTDSLDVHACTPFVWNPADGTTTHTPQPKLTDGTTKVNLFCSGHALLPDGRLLVVGGHQADSDGLSQATFFDWRTNAWTPTTPMTTPSGQQVRRWYPTAITLANGDVLVLSGSYIDRSRPAGKQTIVVDLLQVFSNGTWKTIPKANGDPLNFIGLPLYPRMHRTSDGRVFMSGTNDRTLLLKTSSPGEWTEVDIRDLGNRDYCPAVLYDQDKILYIGGGNDAGTHRPTAESEVIDVGASPRQWRRTNPMKFRRRQHNAVLLPDGTVLVTGGTRGGGGLNNGFNDLGQGQPVHTAEAWDPATEQWTELAAESVDRCYHATAVLLPDATVMSAGGGEYRPDDVNPNDPQDSHRNAQIFQPPYLFKGPRPQISAAPAGVDYNQTFAIGTPQANDISRVSLIRLPSVTHSFDENQGVTFLNPHPGAGQVTVTAPASPAQCAPGHYMMFLISSDGVPSVAQILQIRAPALVAAAQEAPTASAVPDAREYLQVYAREAEVARAASGTAVVVGITGTCPYGIGACWGGAYEALRRLDGVALVSPIPDVRDSTAEVFLRDERLPAFETWRREFRRIANGTYELRGVEVSLDGFVVLRDDQLTLIYGTQRTAIPLAAMTAAEKIQWDHRTRSRRPLEAAEEQAYQQLAAAYGASAGSQPVTVTGPLEHSETGYVLSVRQFTAG
jgi:hypothetical protein